MYLKYMRTLFYTIQSYILYVIAPPICAYCKQCLQERTTLCGSCRIKIMPLVSVVVPVTKLYHMPVFAAGAYADPLKKLILAKGWSDYVASCELARLVCELTPITQMEFDIIIPIPLHWSRYAWRGYNQAYEIAVVIARHMNIPCIDALARIRATPLQSSVAHTDRALNVKQVFIIKEQYKKMIYGKRVLLVDDLMTTGATLQSAAKIIARFRPDCLAAVVPARVK